MNEIDAKQQAFIAAIQKFRLFDDAFMAKIFQQIPCTEELIRTILENDELTVSNVTTQLELNNLQGRSAVLDIFASDGENIYDIEVQRDDRGASPQRARYNSALMDANALPEGVPVEKLPKNYVIFITENDFWGKGQGLYKVERIFTNVDGNPSFGDGTHIIYVNGRYRGDDPIGRLMADFSETDPDKMNSEVLKKYVKQFKEIKGGSNNMNSDFEEYVQKWEIEPALNNKCKEFAEKLWDKGYRDYNEISELTDLPVGEVKKLFEGKSA